MRLHSLCSFGVSWAHYFNDIQYSTVYYTFTVRESPAESTVGRKTTPTHCRVKGVGGDPPKTGWLEAAFTAPTEPHPAPSPAGDSQDGRAQSGLC